MISTKEDIKLDIINFIYSVNKTLYIPLYGKAYVSKTGIILHDAKAEEISYKFAERFPEILRILLTDVDAAYDGDPASGSKEAVPECAYDRGDEPAAPDAYGGCGAPAR